MLVTALGTIDLDPPPPRQHSVIRKHVDKQGLPVEMQPGRCYR